MTQHDAIEETLGTESNLDENALTFIELASYEFVGGGNAANGY